MRVLLTGCNGMVGYWLSRSLSESDHHTLATGRGDFRLDNNLLHDRFSYTSMDLTNPRNIMETVVSFGPDIIIHGAAMTQVDECETNQDAAFAINVDGTALMIAAAKQTNAYFCYLSTDFVFSGNEGPYRETDTRDPVNFYGKTKKLAEDLVQESGLKWSIARTILLYGKADQIKRTNFIYWVKENLEQGRQIQVVNDQIRTPTFLPDFCQGIMQLVTQQQEGIFHISGEDILTPYQMAVIVATHLGLDHHLLKPVDASTFTQPGKRPLRTGFVVDKAKKTWGYRPTPFLKSLSLIFPHPY